MDLAGIRGRLGRAGVWGGPLQQRAPAEMKEVLRSLEGWGYGSYWISEALGREALAHAAVVLSAGSDLVIGTGIANIYARDPLAMANGGRTLEEAFPGRVLLGVGVSHQPMVEQRGHSYGGPVPAMRAYLAAMASAPWRGPAAGSAPPVVLAALGPRMLQLARDAAAGAHPYFVPVAHTAEARRLLGPDRLLLPEQAVVLAEDRRAARAVADAHTSVYLRLANYRRNLERLGWPAADLEPPGSDALFDVIVAWGDEAAVARRVEEHIAAGADSVLLQALAEPLETLGRLAPALELKPQ